MNGEKHDQQPDADPWAPVTISATEVAEHQQLRNAYEQTLNAAGYGPDQRERYINESGHDPEYAACVWDEEILPAAEAAGAIPEHPSYFDPAERATLDVRNAAIDEFWKQHPQSDYDVFNNSEESQRWFKQAMTYGDTKAREALGDQVAEHLLSSRSPAAGEELAHEADDHDMDL
ncbi:hypothetical protein ACH40E_38035 [Streptomyces acidicola]|uniref:hypothetical protein n=1 Tax=Streptomyces acidicola TaxID=2596892 RepID=UPI00378E30B0